MVGASYAEIGVFLLFFVVRQCPANVPPIYRLLRGGLESENIDSVSRSVQRTTRKRSGRWKAVQIRGGYRIVLEQCQRD